MTKNLWTNTLVTTIRPTDEQTRKALEAGKGDVKVQHPKLSRLAIRFRWDAQANAWRLPGTYTYYFSVGGVTKRTAIDEVGAVPLEHAVKETERFSAMVSRDENPNKEKIRQKVTAGQNFGASIEPFKAYLAKQGRKPKYIEDVERQLNRMPDLRAFGFGEINRGMVADQLNKIEEKHGERTSGIARAQLSSFYGFAMAELGYLGSNPVEGTRNRPAEVRTRVLDEKEIVLIWKATEQPTDFNIIVRLLLLTASRLNMIASLQRAEINLGEGRLEIAADRMKGGLDFWVALSRQAKAILEKVKDRRVGSTFVFGEGKGGYQGYAKSMQALYERITELNDGQEIPHWTLHDFRRTFTTIVSDKCGVDERDADLCLSHFGGGVRAGSKKHYNHAKFFAPKLAALQTWGDFVDQLVHGKREFKVV